MLELYAEGMYGRMGAERIIWRCTGGRTQEAIGYFRRAVETSSRGNEDAEKELRILGVEI